jgi:hypothetical protein
VVDWEEGRATIYRVEHSVAAGDIVRLFAESVSHNVGSRELHALGIFGALGQISTWTSENSVPTLPNLPLWADCYEKAATEGTSSYEVKLQGGFADAMADVGDGGYLYGMQFRPLRSLGSDSRLLTSADELKGPEESFLVTANSGWRPLVAEHMTLEEGDVVRATGFVLVNRDHEFDRGINCYLSLRIADEEGGSNVASKYVTPLLEVLPLRTEVVFTAPSSGAYVAELAVSCSRSDASPRVEVVGGSSLMFVERFGKSLR